MSKQHAWPCNPFTTGCGPMWPIAVADWVELRRCEGCGLLWEFPDRGAHRVSLEHVRETYPDAPAIPRSSGAFAPPSPVRSIAAQLNQGELFRLVVIVGSGAWSVRDRGAFVPETLLVDQPAEIEAEDALTLVAKTWGDEAAAALRLALATGFAEEALHALDVVQGFAREDWEHPWQPGTAEIVDAMLAVRPHERVAVAAEIGLRRGIPREDLARHGLLPDREIGTSPVVSPTPVPTR